MECPRRLPGAGTPLEGREQRAAQRDGVRRGPPRPPVADLRGAAGPGPEAMETSDRRRRRSGRRAPPMPGKLPPAWISAPRTLRAPLDHLLADRDACGTPAREVLAVVPEQVVSALADLRLGRDQPLPRSPDQRAGRHRPGSRPAARPRRRMSPGPAASQPPGLCRN
jgi:hypothetical protein